MARITKVYWDSCAWLGLLNRESDKLVELEYVWNQAQSGDVEIWTSTISEIEVSKLATEKLAIQKRGYAAKTEIMTDENLIMIENLFNQPFVKRVSLDHEISSRARRLFRETKGLNKPSDAAHLASAMKWNIQIIHTYDGSDLLHLNGKAKTDDGTVIEICVPSVRPEEDLFATLDD